MSFEAKPLSLTCFARVWNFSTPLLDDGMRRKLDDWATSSARRIDRQGEEQLLPDFLTDYFVSLLGYTGPAGGGERYTLSRERHVPVDGEYADAVLGEFNGESRFIVAVEGKGPRDPLDRPFAGRRMSAVDQAYRYAINLPCDWIIVTSMRETRLYNKGSNQQTYEAVRDRATCRQRIVLAEIHLSARGQIRVVPPIGRCDFTTCYIIEQALGGVLRDRFDNLRRRHEARHEGRAIRAVLADPRIYQLDSLTKPQRPALVRFWEAWQDELTTIRLLDPACGSGAFLIEAFDQLPRRLRALERSPQELRGHRTLFDLDKRILENNLYGVDLERRGDRNLPPEPVDQNGRARQSPDEPRPPDPRRQQRRLRPGRSSESLRLASRLPRSFFQGRFRRRRRQSAVYQAGMDRTL